MVFAPCFDGLVGEVGNDNGFSFDSCTRFCCHIIFIGFGLTCGCGFTFFSICFCFQTHFSLDCRSERCGAELPCLIDVNVDGNCTSLGTPTESFRVSYLVVLGTHLYSEEYVSPVTCLCFVWYLSSCLLTSMDDWALLSKSLGTQIDVWFVYFVVFLGTHLSVRFVDGSCSFEGQTCGVFSLEVDAISSLEAMSPWASSCVLISVVCRGIHSCSFPL